MEASVEYRPRLKGSKSTSPRSARFRRSARAGSPIRFPIAFIVLGRNGPLITGLRGPRDGRQKNESEGGEPLHGSFSFQGAIRSGQDSLDADSRLAYTPFDA